MRAAEKKNMFEIIRIIDFSATATGVEKCQGCHTDSGVSCTAESPGSAGSQCAGGIQQTSKRLDGSKEKKLSDLNRQRSETCRMPSY
jgi:hypothetical protein